MSSVRFQARSHPLEPGESVLDALLRGGADVPYSCKKGICHSCVLRATSAEPPGAAQTDLKDTLRAQRCFLACMWHPDSAADLEVEALDDLNLYIGATVTAKSLLSPEICRLQLDTAVPLYYHAGQFINLRGPHNTVRSYSLASVPALDQRLELHVRRLNNGALSNWIHDSLQVGDTLEMQGPNGRCFYLAGRPEQPLLLIGTGSGAAPLWGIVRDALAAGHRGPIHFYHGSRHQAGLYLHAQLQALQLEHPQFHYSAAVSGIAETPATDFRPGRADMLALQDHHDLTGWRVFLCGNPLMVKQSRKRCYLAGAAMADIYVDPFELTDLRKEPRNGA